MRNKITYALINALATAIYIVIIVSLISTIGDSFLAEKKETILIPMAMLMLFVFSAALTGFLIFGRPVIWYLDGKKSEALSLLGFTLLFFLIFTIIMFVTMFVFSYLVL